MSSIIISQIGKGDSKNKIYYYGNSFWADPYNVPNYITSALGGEGVNYDTINLGVGASAIGYPGSGTNYLLYNINTRLLNSRNENRLKDIIMTFELINDLYFQLIINPTLGVEQVKVNVLEYISQVTKRGFLLVINTLTPRANVGTPSEYESSRQEINTWLRSLFNINTGKTRIFANPNNQFVILVDVGADPRFGQAGQTSNPLYYQASDLVHPTPLMSQILATEYYSLTPNLF